MLDPSEDASFGQSYSRRIHVQPRGDFCWRIAFDDRAPKREPSGLLNLWADQLGSANEQPPFVLPIPRFSRSTSLIGLLQKPLVGSGVSFWTRAVGSVTPMISQFVLHDGEEPSAKLPTTGLIVEGLDGSCDANHHVPV